MIKKKNNNVNKNLTVNFKIANKKVIRIHNNYYEKKFNVMTQ